MPYTSQGVYGTDDDDENPLTQKLELYFSLYHPLSPMWHLKMCIRGSLRAHTTKNSTKFM